MDKVKRDKTLFRIEGVTNFGMILQQLGSRNIETNTMTVDEFFDELIKSITDTEGHTKGK